MEKPGRLRYQLHAVHVIATDDPEGIERYWRARFQDKRREGDRYSLSDDDVRAFKMRRLQ